MFPYQELSNNLRKDLEEYLTNSGQPLTVLDEDFPLSGWSESVAAVWSLWRSFYKKLAPTGITQAMTTQALDKFLKLNRSITPGRFSFDAQSGAEEAFYGHFVDCVHKTLSESPFDAGFDLEFIRGNLATGPGASRGHDNENFYTKLFRSCATATDPYLFALYRAAIVEIDYWADAERQRTQEFGDALVPGNTLFFVPKTTEIARTCCTEPGINMIIQKALGAYMEQRLEKCFGIRLDTQPDLNRALARVGSTLGNFGTIDLQSASDSIRLSLCEAVIPSRVLGFMKVSRSPVATLPSGDVEELRMVSTMGNGFTFPLQTILFSSVVRSVYSVMGIPEYEVNTSGGQVRQWGVFGDDIVVRREAYDFTVRMLQKLCFVVNDTKSFNSGEFRESCGYDYYDGAFVRGVYVRSLETVSDAFSAINRLNRWSGVHSIRLRRTIGMLLNRHNRLVAKFAVPPSEAVDCGVQVPFKLSRPEVDQRYWFKYQKLVPKRRMTELPMTPEGARAVEHTSFNQNGVYVTLLGGYAKAGDTSITDRSVSDSLANRTLPEHIRWMAMRFERGERRLLKRVRTSIPWWDWSGPEESVVYTEYPSDEEGSPYDTKRFFDHASWSLAVEAHTA